MLIGYHSYINPRDYCFKKDYFDAVNGYNTDMNLYEDLDFMIRLSRKLPFYCTDMIGTAYRVLSSGLSSKPVEEHNKVKKMLFKKYTCELPTIIKIVCACLRELNCLYDEVKWNIKVFLGKILRRKFK